MSQHIYWPLSYKRIKMLHIKLISVPTSFQEKERRIRRERIRNRTVESDGKECRLEPADIKEEKWMERWKREETDREECTKCQIVIGCLCGHSAAGTAAGWIKEEGLKIISNLFSFFFWRAETINTKRWFQLTGTSLSESAETDTVTFNATVPNDLSVVQRGMLELFSGRARKSVFIVIVVCFLEGGSSGCHCT